MELVEYPFVLVRDGRSNIDFRRLHIKLAEGLVGMCNLAYSTPCVGLGASTKSGRGGDDSIVISPSGVLTGVGD
jgi:hypothetical protein